MKKGGSEFGKVIRFKDDLPLAIDQEDGGLMKTVNDTCI